MIHPWQTSTALGPSSPEGKPSPEIAPLDQTEKPIAQFIGNITYCPKSTQPINHLMHVTPHVSLRKAKEKATPLLLLI